MGVLNALLLAALGLQAVVPLQPAAAVNPPMPPYLTACMEASDAAVEALRDGNRALFSKKQRDAASARFNHCGIEHLPGEILAFAFTRPAAQPAFVGYAQAFKMFSDLHSDGNAMLYRQAAARLREAFAPAPAPTPAADPVVTQAPKTPLIPLTAEEMEKQVRAALMKRLRDPLGAQLMGLRQSKIGAICGNVNAKNGYGAFTGFKPFALKSDVFVMPGSDDAVGAAELDLINALCRD